MRLLTLNTHSLVEENYEQKLVKFVVSVEKLQPDIIALQEVNQSADANVIRQENVPHFYPCAGSIPLRADNHMYRAAQLLKEHGLDYYWTWLGMKRSYEKYEEGLGLFSRSEIVETDMACISKTDDYENWKTRKILGIRTKELPKTWFYSVHMGWWEDVQEPFKDQWMRLEHHLENRQSVWLMGDFNSPAQLAGEGYMLMEQSGWQDSYGLAKQKDSGITVAKAIDGWRDKGDALCGMRMDQIWCNQKKTIHSSKVVFQGVTEPIVSDHYGVLVESESR